MAEKNRVLKLYVTGSSARSRKAIANLRRIAREELAGKFEIAVVDILERPQLAEDEKIMATPTLIKELPPPFRRVIGDLSDTERVLLGLDMASDGKPKHQPPPAAGEGRAPRRVRGKISH